MHGYQKICVHHTLRFEIDELELFKIYWLHEWKFKCNSKSKITPDDVNIFFYSPQLLSSPGRESFRRDVWNGKMWLRLYIQAVSGLLSRSANTIFLAWKIMYRTKYLRSTKGKDTKGVSFLRKSFSRVLWTSPKGIDRDALSWRHRFFSAQSVQKNLLEIERTLLIFDHY